MPEPGTIGDLASQSLDLVNRELASTLDAARKEIEDYVDGQSGGEALLRAAGMLHLAAGALKIIEIHGAALLAEEMEQACRALAEVADRDAAADGIDALTRAMVQLPAYLERLMNGGQNLALVLLPLLNDLRRVRNRPQVSEGTLLLLNATAEERASFRPPAPASVDYGRKFRNAGLKVRPAFQSALLGFIRGEQVTANLEELINVATMLRAAAQAEANQQLWDVLRGVLIGLWSGGLEPSVQLKRLIGQADRQLKRLIDSGEGAFAEAPPAELLKSLLYYVASTRTDHPDIARLKSAYELEDLLPHEEQLADAREQLAGPSVKLMQTVAQAIKQDLGAVKDVLDILVRTGMQDLSPLKPQIEMLKKIGDTLGVLGLDEAGNQIQNEARELGVIVAGNKESAPATLERTAATLLAVEDALDRELVRAVAPRGERVATAETDESVQYRQVTEAVMSECVVNLAKVKEAVISLVAGTADARALEQVKLQLRGIVAGLLMLNRTRAVKAVERVGAIIAARLAPGHARLEAEHVERLADAIVSVEYYMQTVSVRRNDPWYMLENAEHCLEVLERLPPPAAPVERAPAAAPTHEPTVRTSSVMSVAEDRSDPELVEIFLAEAKEELGNIEQHLPRWLESAQNVDALIAVRRSFHTLKGSGRMVGAELMGEFAWSVESLLNRVINQTLMPTPALHELVGDAVRVLPELIEQLEAGIAPRTDLAEFMRRAAALTAVEPPVEPSVDATGVVTPTDSPPDEAPAKAPAEASAERRTAAAQALQMDPVLSAIFEREMRSHVAAIAEFAAAARQGTGPTTVSEALHRACHTLLGSARMADCRPVMALAAPLNARLATAHEQGAALRIADVAVLDDVAQALGVMADGVAAGEAVEADPVLLDRIEALAVPPPAPESRPESEPDAEPALEADAASTHEPEPGAERALEAGTAPTREPEPNAEGLAANTARVAAPARPREAADVVPTVPFASYDPEIAAIFAEEATELLEHAEGALAEIASGAAPGAALAELKRLLHTLKGGARMAGVSVMGDLSHALETLVTDLSDGVVPSGEPATALLQRCLDQLHQMRDAIDAGRPAPAVPGLIAEIAAIAMGGAGPSTAPSSEAPSEVAAPLAAEPALVVGALEPEPALELTLEADPAPGLGLDVEAALVHGDVAALGLAGEVVPLPLSPLEPEAELGSTPAAEVDAYAEGDADAEADEDSGAAVEAEAEAEAQAQAKAETQAEAQAEGETEAQAQAKAEAKAAAEAQAPAGAQTEAQPEDDADAEDGAGREDDAEDDTEAEAAAEAEAEAGRNAAHRAERAAAAFAPAPRERADLARIEATVLDALLNGAGEISIFQSRLKQQLRSIEFHLSELGQTVTRLREQLRGLEVETEAQILHTHQEDAAADRGFDPLELDRYSTIQQLSRALAETSSDVASINELLHGLASEADTLLTQQTRVTSELQSSLMQTRMVSLKRHVSRLERIVRRAAVDTGKRAELVVNGADALLDRQVLESILPAFEHLLRNAVVHGVEGAERRRAAGKPETGRVELSLRREGAEVLVEVADDGAGLDYEAIRRKARELGMLAEGQLVSDQEAAEFILRPGFSTAGELTQAAGRGVGMDVVDTEIKKLAGSMRIESVAGKGTRFLIRLPYTLAVTHALIVNVGDETFALPLPTVEGVARVRRTELLATLTRDEPTLEYAGVKYRVQHLGSLIGSGPSALPEEETAVSLVLVRAGESSAALLPDSLEGSREVVVKTLGPHIGSVPGISGATILGDGRIVMILDLGSLVRAQPVVAEPVAPAVPAERELAALVVDDSITMRRVSQRLLERRGVKVFTARDGLDAIAVLQDHSVDFILLDIEMPRMDGYQFASHVRNDPRIKDLPIIMITSRSGEKHRAKAIEIGVNDYLSKPYQEHHLVKAIEALLGRPL